MLSNCTITVFYSRHKQCKVDIALLDLFALLGKDIDKAKISGMIMKNFSFRNVDTTIK